VEKIKAATTVDYWRDGFTILLLEESLIIGLCGYKGPPKDGVVEVAYGVAPAYGGKGYATEAAEALTAHAFAAGVKTVLAHTLPELNASGRVLTKCGFECMGEVIDPEDGLVWRWVRHRTSDP
jgi:RimJ/RimL family protein N-acetyltransferase